MNILCVLSFKQLTEVHFIVDKLYDKTYIVKIAVSIVDIESKFIEDVEG